MPRKLQTTNEGKLYRELTPPRRKFHRKLRGAREGDHRPSIARDCQRASPQPFGYRQHDGFARHWSGLAGRLGRRIGWRQKTP
jgi:hypothetical protein